VSTPHPRDRALEELLRRQMPQASAETDACADPETLAAWAEGGLDAPAMAETELHLSNCARCQAMLAAIVRSEPDAPAAEPWWSHLRARWLVPLTAAAAVLWVVVGPGARQEAPVPGPESTQARVERSAPEASAPQSMGAVTAEPATSPTASPSSPPARTTPRSQAADEARTAAPSAGRAGAEASVAGDRARAEAPPGRQALAKQEAPATPARSNELARDRDALEEKATITGVSPAAEAPQAARAMPSPPAPVAGSASAVGGLADATAMTIPSRDAAVRWRLAEADVRTRVGTTAVIERSEDAGATWQRLNTGLTRRFTAGFAPSATVCWLVGPAGTVALTTDARTWRQLSAPAPDANLTSIEASDARTATVRDTQGRRFRTTDGGATWTAVP